MKTCNTSGDLNGALSMGAWAYGTWAWDVGVYAGDMGYLAWDIGVYAGDKRYLAWDIGVDAGDMGCGRVGMGQWASWHYMQTVSDTRCQYSRRGRAETV